MLVSLHQRLEHTGHIPKGDMTHDIPIEICRVGCIARNFFRGVLAARRPGD
jgi:hypothetical protein